MSRQLAMSYFFRPQKTIEKRLTPYHRNTANKDIRQILARIKEDTRPDAYKIWQGFLFTATNNFSEYKVQTLIFRQVSEKFLDSPKDEVASATVDDYGALENIDVRPEYRRNKIGVELIRFINKCRDGNLMIFGGKEHNSRYRLTDEGAALAHFCVNNKILTEKQFIKDEVPPSPESSLGY